MAWKAFVVLFAIKLVFGSSASAEEAWRCSNIHQPEYYKGGGTWVADQKYVECISLNDNVTVTDVEVNRGNCPFNNSIIGVTRKFGEEIRIWYQCRAIVEVKITTNNGSETYRW